MAIDNLPDPPQSNDPANFNSKADAFLAALPTMVTQINAALTLLGLPTIPTYVDVLVDANVSISGGGIANGVTKDGGLLTTGMRVLLISQTTQTQNGVYDVPASGAASRSTDANSADLMPAGRNF